MCQKPCVLSACKLLIHGRKKATLGVCQKQMISARLMRQSAASDPGYRPAAQPSARGLCCKHLNTIGAIKSFNGIADHAAERISHWAPRTYFDTVCRNGFEAGGAGTLPCRI